MLINVISWYELVISKIKKADFIPLLLIRLFLIPVIFAGAHSKVMGFSGTVAWFSLPAAEGGLTGAAVSLAAGVSGNVD